MMLKDGWLRAATRIYRRVWQLYVAHILLFVAFTAQIAYVSIARDTPQLLEEMQLLGLGQNPYRAILEAALLKFRPVNLDVLPLYIVLLACLPLLLPALLRWPWAVLLGRSGSTHWPATSTESAGLSRRQGLVLQSGGVAGGLLLRSRAGGGGAGSAVSTAGGARRPRWPCSISPLPPLSPCPGTIIRWNASFPTGCAANLPDRQDQHRHPAVRAFPGLAWIVRLLVRPNARFLKWRFSSRFADAESIRCRYSVSVRFLPSPPRSSSPATKIPSCRRSS
jgi:hypothetical protein